MSTKPKRPAARRAQGLAALARCLEFDASEDAHLTREDAAVILRAASETMFEEGVGVSAIVARIKPGRTKAK